MPSERRAFCVFEYIYFARPDSRMGGTVLQVARARMGENLWREAPVDADVVIPVPDSGNAAARGLARASGLPTDDGFIKNRYIARTFIQPGQELRRQGVRMKFNPVPEVVAGKRLIVVDDSIVRGTTDRQIVKMLRDAGAAEIHLRISAPPIKHPCHYGIDMSTREEMIAHGRSVEEICAELGADSLHYLSLQGVYDAIGGSRPSTATRASAATTRWPGPKGPTASTRWSTSSRSPRCNPSRPPQAYGLPGGGGIVGRPMDVSSALSGCSASRISGAAQAEAVDAALDRSRRARRDADRRGQVAVLPAAGPDARRPDDRRLAAGGADARPGDGRAPHRARPGDDDQLPAQPRANAQAMERVRRGEVRLLYVAPERFGSPAFARALADAAVGLFVVDEAHCVSEWGHDFRPDYFTLADVAARLGARSMLALTATATPRVAADIADRLRLRDPVQVTTGFDRPNLSFAVVRCGGPTDKEHRLVAALRRRRAPAIVYAGTRYAREKLAAILSALGVGGVAYHAGMAPERRGNAQEQFMSGARRRDRRHQRVRHGHRQGRRAHRLPRRRARLAARPTTRKPAAPVATARPRGACCSPSRGTRACTSSSSSARG